MKKEEQENPEMQLVESVQVIAKINCDFCINEDSADGETDYYQYFYQEGWRARTKTYCPDCAKKKLKNNS